MTGPVLQTERLELRWLSVNDAPMMLAVWNDPAFVKFVGDRGVRTLEDAESSMREGLLQIYAEHGYGPFLVTRRDDGTQMGICGYFHRENLDAPDIGFALLNDYCGQGFGYESSAAVLEHGRVALRLPRVLAIVSPENNASIALLEKLGLSYDRPIRMPGDEHDVLLYCIEFAG